MKLRKISTYDQLKDQIFDRLTQHVGQILFYLCLKHPGFLPLAGFFDKLEENVITILSLSLNG